MQLGSSFVSKKDCHVVQHTLLWYMADTLPSPQQGRFELVS